ncbi:MAG: ATP-binding protein, partial [bacterium]|nr:ATP-binding protein [bacterium]
RALFDLNEAIETILPLLRLKFQSSGVNVKTSYAPSLPLLFGNKNRIQQVVMNLLTNAIHAMPQGGTISLVTEPVGSQGVGLKVQDSGVGISPENLPRIFDPYFTTKAVDEGTGLGLSICYSIIEEHAGKIEVTSTVGKGSCFSIRLPLTGGPLTGGKK